MRLADIEAQSAQATDAPSGILVKSYTSVGILRSLGSIEVEAREMVNLDAKRVDHFIVVTVSENGDYARTGATVIREENLGALVEGIERLTKATIDRKRFAFTEIELGVDDLKIVVFNTKKPDNMAAISADGVTVHLDQVWRLNEFKDLVIKAKKVIDDNRPMRA